jgi:hypothetical protein
MMRSGSGHGRPTRIFELRNTLHDESAYGALE